MDSIQCKVCGRIIENNGTQYCIQCIEDDKNFYQPIRDYLQTHPRTSAFIIMDLFKVSPARLRRYLKDGLLEITEEDNLFLKCEMCKVSIKYGRYCNKCVSIMQRELCRKINNCSYIEENELKSMRKYINFSQRDD